MQELKSSTMNSITDLFLDFRNYVAENFGAYPDDVDLSWNCVGATIHYFDAARTIQFRLWERSEGHRGIPDMTIIVININFRGKTTVIRPEMETFTRWLANTARLYGFLHIADENQPPLTVNQVPGCHIACLALK